MLKPEYKWITLLLPLQTTNTADSILASALFFHFSVFISKEASS